MIVHEPIPADGGVADAGRGGFTVETLRPCVHCLQGEGGSPAFQLHVGSIVIGNAPPLAVNVHAGEVRIRSPCGHWAIAIVDIDIVPVGVLSGTEVRILGRKGLRNVIARQQVRAFVADIVYLERGIRGELALDGKGPLLDIGVAWLLGDDHRNEAEISGSHRSDGREGGEQLVCQLGCRSHRLRPGEDARLPLPGVAAGGAGHHRRRGGGLRLPGGAQVVG